MFRVCECVCTKVFVICMAENENTIFIKWTLQKGANALHKNLIQISAQ